MKIALYRWMIEFIVGSSKMKWFLDSYPQDPVLYAI